MVFVPGNRTYDEVPTNGGTKGEIYAEIIDPDRQIHTSESSTDIRRLFYCYEDRAHLRNTLKSLVLNEELLAMYLGIDGV